MVESARRQLENTQKKPDKRVTELKGWAERLGTTEKTV